MATYTIINGQAQSYALTSGQSLEVAGGGTSNASTIPSNTSESVDNGGASNNDVISGGYQYIDTGGTAQNTVATGATILSLGNITNSTFNTSSVSLIGGFVLGTVFNNSSVDSFATLSYTTINGGGVTSRGPAVYTTVNGGSLTFSTYAVTAKQTTVNAGGTVTFARNTTASNTFIAGGSLVLQAGSQASNGITFQGQGRLEIDDVPTDKSYVFGSSLNDIAAGDLIDLAGLSYTTFATATVNGSTLVVDNGTASETFALQNTTAQGFAVSLDAKGGILLTATAQPTAKDQVSFDSKASFAGNGTFLIGGTVSSAAGVKGVEISAMVDGQQTDLGAATVNADGTFLFSDFVGRHVQGLIVATATNGAGVTTTQSAPYSLQAGIQGAAYRAEQVAYSADGGSLLSDRRFRADGSSRLDVGSAGQTIASNFFDTVANHGAPSNTFVFDPGFGRDTIAGLRLGGADHDTLSFKGSDFGNDIASVLLNTHYEKGGAVILDPTSGDTVKLVGVTKQQLVQNQGDIAFHA